MMQWNMMRWNVMAVGMVSLILLGCNSNTVPSAETTSPDSTSESQVAQTAETPVNPAPTVAPASTTVLKSGNFESGEHPTQGTAQLVQQDGQTFLELDESFQTSTSGPDLFVILHRSDNVLGNSKPPVYPLNEGEYVIIAPLQEYSGAQRYAIPADINVDEFRSAGIWCRQFNATFGAALLQ